MTLRVVAAPDSFKESMSAAEAAAAIRAGVLETRPDAEVVLAPVSDGGEGLLDVLADDQVVRHRTPVSNALGEDVEAEWLQSGARAIIEVAKVVGLADIAPDERRIMDSDTRGVGQLVLAAIEQGCLQIVLGLGGTATNDGGAGMLASLGARFLDAAGLVLEPTPAKLRGLHQVDLDTLDERLGQVQLVMASDVTSPLVGPAGASATFGPQKGATPEQVEELDQLLANLAFLVEAQQDQSLSAVPGAGAAGGLGWALLVVGANPRPGLELVAELLDLEQAVAVADLVITGEGSFDEQSLQGKVVQGIARMAARHQTACHVLAGRVGAMDEQVLREHGIAGASAITPPGTPLPEALAGAEQNLRRAAAALVRDY
ncbi:glycerate kinase [Propionibacteriaceae bacterium Y1923]|uniref:glycerate kinase n=1 Tax=Aestuariimicrobium sp. Y1814 TaxID=3418742 RepID=UPI003C1447D3